MKFKPERNLSKKPTIKKKLLGLRKTAGRNNSGKITIRHRGKGAKRNYRKIDFFRNTSSIGVVYSIEYDPNRNALIAAVYCTIKRDFFYILAPQKLKVGDIVKSGKGLEARLGYSLPITDIPVGSYLYNVTLRPKKGGQFSRAAGTFSILKEKTFTNARITLNSGEQRRISPKCYASIGMVSNESYRYKTKTKAGESRWLGVRPTVRGVAMNPVDHPHGGGEGKKSGKGKNIWGKPTHLPKKTKLKSKNG